MTTTNPPAHKPECALMQPPRVEVIRGDRPSNNRARYVDDPPLRIRCTCGAHDPSNDPPTTR